MREADGRGVVCAANVHNFSKKANDAVLGQDVLNTASFYRGDIELKESVSVRGANWEKWSTYEPGDRRNGTGCMFCT